MKSSITKVALIILAVFSSGAGTAGQVDWAHQNGSISSNGAVTVKSVTSGSYAGTTNPTGVVAKSNQTANTQPPTVIIKTISINRWSMYYTDRAVGLPGS